MPPRDDNQHAKVTEWVVFALSDLHVANGPRAKGARAAAYAFHAQQAVEKILKAVLIAHGVEPPNTHDIRGLSVLIEVHTPHELPEHLYHDAALLTRYEAEFSRPDELGDVAEEDVDFAVSTARHVQDWALDTLDIR